MSEASLILSGGGLEYLKALKAFSINVSIVTSVRMINCDYDASIVIRALCSSSVSLF